MNPWDENYGGQNTYGQVDPGHQYEGRKARAEASRATGQAAITGAQVPYAGQVAEAEAAKARSDARMAEVNLQLKQLEAAQGKDPDAAVRAAQSLLRILDEPGGVAQQFKDNFQDNGVLKSLGEYNPFSDQNAAFDASAGFLKPASKKLFRAKGEGSQSDAEGKDYNALIPGASKLDATNQVLIDNLRQEAIDTLEGYNQPIPDFSRPEQQAPTQQAPIPPQQNNRIADATQQRMVDGRGGGMAPTQNSYETVDNPELAGLNNEVMQMLLSGSDTGSIAEHIKGRGVNPLPMLEAIQANVDIQKTNPGVRPQINLDDMSRAISPERQVLSNVADSGFGAYGVGAANMLTAGTLDEIAGGNSQQTKEYLGSQYPGATLAGNISGGALAMAPIGRATQALTGLNAGKAALAGDVAYGAATGAGEFNDNRLMGAGLGAVGAGIGNKLGTGISNSLGRATRGVTDKAVNKLNNSGVPMTLGQMVGEGGLVGRSIKAMEDGLESVPVLGSAIRNQREAGFKKFNEAAFDEALQPIGQNVPGVGPQGIEQAMQATNRGYDDALGGVTIPADEQFGAEVARANTLGSTTPDFGAQYTNIIDRKIAPIAAGADNIDGRQFQQLRRAAEGYGRKYDKVANGPTPQPMAEDVSTAFMGIRDALDGTVERNAPGVLPAYQNANKAYGNVMTLKDAVSRSRNGTRSGEAGLFAPSQLNDAAESTAKKFGNKGGTTQRPFYELGEAGQKVLPSNIGNSGTVDRALATAALPAALGGAGYATGLVDPETAMLIAAAGAPYTGAGRKLTQKALLQRPQAMIDAGNAIMKRNRLGGVFGASTGLGLLPR